MNQSLRATLAACAIVGLAFVWALGSQTDSFEHWTFESRRIALAQAGQLGAGSLVLRSPQHPRSTAFDGEDSVYLLDFVYTRCLTVCRALGSEFTQMQDELRRADATRVRLLSVSIDPLHDDDAALAGFGLLHRSDSRYWTVAAPVQAEAGERLRRQLGVIVIADGADGFVHNGDIHLVDGNGRLLAIYDYTEWRQALKDALHRSAGGART